jgi:AhpD family alkylhydroperoxidase
MARISHAQPRGLDPVRRLTFALSRRIYGRELEPTQVVAHHRPLLAGYGVIGLTVDRFSKTVDVALRNLAMLRASQLIGCEWCLDFGSKLARDSGIPEVQLRELSLWRQSEHFSDTERLVIEYAEEMTRTPVEVSDELFERLRAVFDERQLVEITMAIAFENLTSRCNWALGIGSEGFSDGAYCVRPDLPETSFAELGAER